MSSKRRNFRVTFAISCVLLAGIAALLVSLTSNLRGARVDLTSDQRFSMSDAAAKVLRNLKVPVQVKLYITPEAKMPTELKNLERDITEQLANFERVSNGMLVYEVLSPQDDDEMQERLARKGIRPFQVQSVERDEFGVKLIWSALTIAYKDYPEEVLPQILPATLANFEALVIGPVYRLTRERTPKVAVYAPLQEVDPQLAAMYLQQGMQVPEPTDTYSNVPELLRQQHYDVERIDISPQSPIPDDADVLLVLNPEELSARQAWEINRALSNGLPTLIAAQVHGYNYSPGYRGGWTVTGSANTTGLETMLASLGLTVATDHFMDRSTQTLDLPREVNLGGIRMQTREPVQFPVQILVTGENMNSESVLTNRIGALLYLWGTPIDNDATTIAENRLDLTVLMTSTSESWRVPFEPGSVDPEIFDPQRHPKEGRQPLGVLVTGTFPDTYAGQEIPTWPETAAGDTLAAAEEPRPLEPQPSRLVVVGCAKMFDDNIIGGAQNSLLLLNAVDYLAGAEELLSIRTKNLTQRYIEQVSAGEKVFYRFFAVFLVPLLIAVFGFARSALRRKETARYQSQLRRQSASNA
jgi:ABC-type uncharacterized transport system involved in gliding motility auxiliary subunit